MAEQVPQSYASHRRFVPLYHFVLSSILVLNFLWAAWKLFRSFSQGSATAIVDGVMGLAVAFALILLFWFCRVFPLAAQDRLIRLEERLRLARVLPEDLKPRIGELTPGQLIALRFASDGELPELCRQVLDAGLTGREEIKKRIRTWRPDTLRV